MRILAFGILAGAGIVLGSFPALAQVTTRVEPRPFYGATVQMEHGVRVIRPLPPHDRVIINPGSRTPLNLWIGDGGSYGQNDGGYSSSTAVDGRGVPGPIGTFLPRGNHHHGHHGGHHHGRR